MPESHVTPEDFRGSFLEAPGDFTRPPTAATTVANVGELVALIFGKMHASLELGTMSKKSVIAASTATKMWRQFGLGYIFRRQVLGNRDQLVKLVALGKYENGRLWKLCTTLIWNGRTSCWRKKGEKGEWYEDEDVVKSMGCINCANVTRFNIFGAFGIGSETHLPNLVRGMPALKWVTFTGRHMDTRVQMCAVRQMAPSVARIDAGTWCAQRFVDCARAEQLELRSSVTIEFFKGRILDALAIRVFVLHFVSHKHTNWAMYGLRRLKHLEELTSEHRCVALFYPSNGSLC